MSVLRLGPNLMTRPYRGGARLGRLRGFDIDDEARTPEDWIGSTTTAFGHPTLGLSTLDDGSTLRDRIIEDPVSFLGSDHLAVFGPDPAILVKLIDVQQRLAVHVHPDRAFARNNLGVTYGKTEAWFILDATEDATVHVGFQEPIDAGELLAVVESGAGGTLLDRLCTTPVRRGDAVFVPAGVPHAIGSGIFLAEIQEPTDLLVRLEWAGYAVGAMPSDLGLGFSRALAAVDRSGWGGGRLVSIVQRDAERPSGAPMLPSLANPFFRLERCVAPGTIAAGFAVLICTAGAGELRATDGRRTPLNAGACYVLPWATGPVDVDGDADLLVFRPPIPSIAVTNDPDLPGRATAPAGAPATGE